MKRRQQTPSKHHGSSAFRLFIMLVLVCSFLLPGIQRPIAAQAGGLTGKRDPIWNLRLTDLPPWLEMVKKPDQLYTEYELPLLAGKLILFGDVDANGCTEGGLDSEKQANRCGMQRALDETYQWQNRFNTAILATSKESGVPPRLLKNIFAWESQFWPERLYVNTFEYGLGHITIMGADTLLRWNAPFYDAVCAASFSSDTCKEAYAEQPENIQAALMGVVVQQANADCPECKYYLDLPLAERSVALFADTLLANATFVKRVIQLRRQAVENIAYEDLWKFTLTSYNAGPGCFANAFSTLVDNQNRLNWENLSRQLEPACRGAVPYVDFISSTSSYYPERDPSSLPPPLPPNKRTPTPGGGIEPPGFTSTVSVTTTPAAATPSPTASETVSQTPAGSNTPITTPAPTALDITPTTPPTAVDATPTPTGQNTAPAPTPTGLDITPTPSPTDSDRTPTPTPAGLDITPTPSSTGLDITPTLTPTAADVKPTATPTELDITLTPTPTAPDVKPTATPTELDITLTPTPTAPDITPTPTVQGIKPTATPTELDITLTPTPTEPDITPTPTVQGIKPTTTPTELDITLTPTPTAPDSTPTPTSTAQNVTSTPTGVITPTLSATLTPTVSPTFTSTPSVEPVEIKAPHANDEIVLKIDPQGEKAARQTLVELGIDLRQDVSEIKQLGALVVQVEPSRLTTILAVLQDDVNFIYAEPDYLVSLASLVNDPEFQSQGNLDAVQAPQTWAALPSMQEVLVAVVDTGVDVTHPDLADRIWQNAGEVGLDDNGNDKRSNRLDDDDNGYIDDWQGWNMISASNEIVDKNGHGTHLAGIIGAGVDNSIGIAGVAPNARILPVKVLDETGSGTYAQVAEGITYAADMGVRVLNLGFSGMGSSELLQEAVDYAIAHDVLLVAAGGNSGSAEINYPAGYPGVLSVSAVDNNGYWTGFPSTGEFISLAAPGMDILSTSPGGGYDTSTGTSQAAAHVAGVAALLAGQPQFDDRDTLQSALLLSARDLGDPGRDPYFGYGMLQAFNALQAAKPVLPVPTPRLLPTETPHQPGGNAPEATLDLWGRAQIATYAITNPADSIDGAFNDLLASSTGPYGGTSARNWTFTAIDDNTFPTIAAVYLDVRLYMTGWVNDSYYIQVYEPTNPSCVAAGWCTVLTLKFNPVPGQPEVLVPTTLTTLSVPVTSLLNTTAKINAVQLRLAGSAITGGSTDNVTIYFDEVRLRVLDVLPPTPTPSPTPLFIPTATIPATRAATAVPGTAEPHSNFSPATDNCASCHRSHTAQSNGLRSLYDEEQVCFSCHTSGGSGTNVQPAFTAYTNSLTAFFSHGVSATRNIHLSDEIYGGQFGGASRHIECEDCHSPHLSARSAAGGSNLAPAVQQEMYQSSGVEPIWIAAGAPISYTLSAQAGREFQICLKCHSTYTTLPTYSPDGYGWNGSSPTIGYIPNGLGKLTSTNPAQIRDSRDMATEFNSYQVSFHPVAAQGRNSNMPAGSFVAPWSQDSIIFCSDCHDNADGLTDGPHGSPLLHILDGSANYITQTDPNAGDGPSIHSQGELCFKCHQYGTYATGANPVTTTRFRDGGENLHAFHSFGSCYACHDSHGSEQDHLINFDTSVVSILSGSNSQSAWSFVNGTGSCSIACHGEDHGNDPGFQYTP